MRQSTSRTLAWFLKVATIVIGTATEVAAQCQNDVSTGITRVQTLRSVCDCPSPSHRETVVIINRDSFSTRIDHSFVQSLGLMPRERLRVILVGPEARTVLPVFNECWPGKTSAEIQAELDKKTMLQKQIDPHPDADTGPLRGQFYQKIGADVASGMTFKEAGAVEATGVKGSFPVLVAMGQFPAEVSSNGDTLRRVIVFSPLNSPSGSAQLTDELRSEAARDVVRQIKLQLDFSDLYFVGGIRATSPWSVGDVRGLLDEVVTSNIGRVSDVSIGLPSFRPQTLSPRKRLSGKWTNAGRQSTARLLYSVDASSASGPSQLIGAGIVIDGNEQFAIPFDGSILCNGSNCEIKGKVSRDVPAFVPKPYFRKGDELVLRSDGKLMTGSLKPAVPLTDNPSFTYDLVFDLTR